MSEYDPLAQAAESRVVTRTVSAVLALCLFAACLAEAQVKSDREQAGLMGAVRTVRIEKTLLSEVNGEYTEGAREVLQLTYNDKGNKLEEVKYRADGSLVNKNTFTYDPAGRLAEVTVYNSDGSVFLKRTYTHKKSSEGKKVEEAVFKSGTMLLAKAVSVYDHAGRGIELATYDANGSPSIKQIITYDTRGQIAEIDYFQDDDSMMGKSVFLYDAQGNITEKTDYNATGLQTGKTVFSKNNKGQASAEIVEYDADGNLRNKETYIREYDSRGNWIKEIKSRWSSERGKPEPTSVTYRTITYY